MRTTRIEAPDGFPLAVQVSGREDGPALLLLAGQANSHRWWTGLREAYDDRYRVVTLDHRGTGDSRGPVGEWSPGTFAGDAAYVLGALGVPRAHVLGTSMGGRVAQVLAVDHPGLVDRLVLVCSSPGGRHAHERGLEVRRSLADADPARRLRALHGLFYTDDWPRRPEESHLLGDPTMSTAERRAHLRASQHHDAWDALPLITAPTLVLHGTEDLMVPAANAPLLASRITGSTVHLHEGGRHGFFEEFAADVVPLVRSFL